MVCRRRRLLDCRGGDNRENEEGADAEECGESQVKVNIVALW